MVKDSAYVKGSKGPNPFQVSAVLQPTEFQYMLAFKFQALCKYPYRSVVSFETTPKAAEQTSTLLYTPDLTALFKIYQRCESNRSWLWLQILRITRILLRLVSRFHQIARIILHIMIDHPHPPHHQHRH